MRISVLALLLVVMAASASPIPNGPEPGPEGDGDPEVFGDEIVGDPIETGHQDWIALYLRYEDPATVACGGRQACEDAMENATAGEPA